MKVLMTGGGSGGHITPLLAIAHELKKLGAKPEVAYVGQKGDALNELPEKSVSIDAVYSVSAGKLRRYHGDGLKALLDIKTIVLNVRDMFRVLAGVWQSWRLLGRLKPDVVFIKGGYVGVPVGLAAAMRKIPYITHDSDAMPGLANRVVGRWASLHAVALPKEVYTYDPRKTVTVGVPISDKFQVAHEREMQRARRAINMADAEQVVLLTGGGNGAKNLNEAMVESAGELLSRFPKLHLVLLVGRKHTAAVTQSLKSLSGEQARRIVVKDFAQDLYNYSAAADVIVARAGATSLAEFAAQHKACIIVPHPGLTGGHQLKNAAELEKRHAIVVMHNDVIIHKPTSLVEPISALLKNEKLRHDLGEALGKFAREDAAEQLALLIASEARQRGHRS